MTLESPRFSVYIMLWPMDKISFEEQVSGSTANTALLNLASFDKYWLSICEFDLWMSRYQEMPLA